MSLTQGYLFDEVTGVVVDTISTELGWHGPLAKSYYEPMMFTPFGAVGTVTVKSVTLNVPSPAAIPFEVVSRITDGTVAVAISGSMPANTLVADAAALNLSALTVNNPVATTGYGIRPVGGFVESTLRPGLFQLPDAVKTAVGDASGLTATLLLSIS